MSGIIDAIINAKFGLAELFGSFKAMFEGAFQEGDVVALLEVVTNSLAAVLPYLPIILLALCAIVTLFGKKLFGLEKFLFIFTLGFVGGVLFLAPVLEQFVALPSYITGAVVGLVCAILCKIIYWLLYVAAFGYAAYFVCFTAAVLPVATVYTQGNMIYSAIAAVVVIVLALLLRKLIEMLGTAALGAFGIVAIVDANFFDFANIGFAEEGILKLAAIGVITLIGFIVQVKTRKRY